MTTTIGTKNLMWTVREYVRINKDADITDEELALGLAECIAQVHGHEVKPRARGDE